MVYVGLELHRAHLPSNKERGYIIHANKVDSDYLLELQDLIRAQKNLLVNLERTYREVHERITRRSAFIARLRYLPTEILIHIFNLIKYEPYNRHFHTRPPWWDGPRRVNTPFISSKEWRSRTPFNISHVSWQWREIALATPKLWNTLVVDTHKQNPTEMVKHWFKHAKDLPVHVVIWQETFYSTKHRYLQRTPDPHTIINILQSVINTLEPHVSQVSSLRIACEEEPEIFESEAVVQDMDLSVICKALARVQNLYLRSLTLDSMDINLRATSRSSLLPQFPSACIRYLTDLHIRGFFLSRLFSRTLPVGLTTLKLDSPSDQPLRATARDEYADLLTLLSVLSNLERLRLRGDYPYYPLNSLPPFHPDNYVTLPHLKRLTVIGHRCIPYWSKISAPNLKILKLKADDYMVEDGSDEDSLVWAQAQRVLPRFLKRCGSSVTKLTLIGLGSLLRNQSLESLLEPMDELRHLVLVQDSALLNDFARPLSGSVGTSSRAVCPSLELLEWKSTTPFSKVDLGSLGSRRGLVIQRVVRRSDMVSESTDGNGGGENPYVSDTNG